VIQAVTTPLGLTPPVFQVIGMTWLTTLPTWHLLSLVPVGGFIVSLLSELLDVLLNPKSFQMFPE